MVDKDKKINEIIQTGKRVIALEQSALGELEKSLGESFKAAVLRIAELQNPEKSGRLIVTGMGKSGHICHKIAATLASTGTPAHFVHPAEASHGDLGMVTQHDLILAMSNSGETSELAGILNYAREQNIDLIAITSKSDSTLARLAKIALILPSVAEASEIGLAPTTSTTLSLALGDALAVALLEYNGFSPEQFRVFHPGGKLGQQLSMVSDYMHSGDQIPLANQDMIMREAIIVMTKGRFGCVGVIDQNHSLIGIVTDGDLRRHVEDTNIMNKKISEVMSHHPKTLSPKILAKQALESMHENKITVFFVVDPHNIPIGIVHIHDFLRGKLG